MKSVLVRFGIFFILLWVGSLIAANRLDNYFQQNRIHKQLWSLSQHDRSFDYAVAGSSRAFHNIDIVTLEQKKHADAINIGYDGHSIIDMYLTIHLFLAHRNRVGNLMLQLDGSDLSYVHKFLNHLYTPYRKDEEVARTLRDFNSLQHAMLARFFPPAAYAEYNDFFTQTLLWQARTRSFPYDKTRGSELLFDDNYHEFPVVTVKPEFVVNSRAREYLDLIVELAAKRSIPLTIFSAPIFPRGQMFEDYDNDSRKYIASYCRQHDIPYLDFTDANFDRSEFRDYEHLNGRGALRFTEMLAENLSKPR